MRKWKSIDEMDLAGRRVLVRLDINVPLEDGQVADQTRILRTRATISQLRQRQAILVIASHLGRPGGKPEPSLSLEQLVPSLEAAYGTPIGFISSATDMRARSVLADAGPGDVFLLENLRFNPGETSNDSQFAGDLAALADVYCNDAFSACHRAHASISGVAGRLPSCAGRLLEEELAALDAALEAPERPVAAIIGGAKVSTKLEVLNHLVRLVDHLVIGGAMANTFLLAMGHEVGRSLVEREMTEMVRGVIEEADLQGCNLVLPVDVTVAEQLQADSPALTVDADKCPADRMILDLGPRSQDAIADLLERCRTLIWNGPAGAFETPPFDRATNSIAATAARLTEEGRLISVAGGGDSVAALNRAGLASAFTYVSTAGGAFLEWMKGRPLPGIDALSS